MSFKEHLPENGHNMWPKHEGGHDDYKKSTDHYMYLSANPRKTVLVLCV